MARLKRKRWPIKKLTTRWRCPEHGPEFYDCWLLPYDKADPTPEIFWRPTRVLCHVCGAECEYEGLVSGRE